LPFVGAANFGNGAEQVPAAGCLVELDGEIGVLDIAAARTCSVTPLAPLVITRIVSAAAAKPPLPEIMSSGSSASALRA
jgi:hypothetical protein